MAEASPGLSLGDGGPVLIPVLLVAGVVLLLPFVWAIVIYNRLVSARLHRSNAWSDVDVQLQRRYDLVPRLVETVKGYAAHERDLLVAVVELRNRAEANHEAPSRQSAGEQALGRELHHLVARCEAYPELKADERFRDLQEELVLTEDRIAAARRFFNANVRELNQLCVSFPTSLVARIGGFEPEGYFESDPDAGNAPEVQGS